MQQPPQNAAGAGQQIPSDQQAYHQQKLSWMMQQQQGQQWNQQSAPSQGQQPYGSQNPGSDNEIRSLWIGALQPWMDESYIMTVFAQAGEVKSCEKVFSLGGEVVTRVSIEILILVCCFRFNRLK